MIESRDGVYSIGGTPCRQLIENAIARGWATKPKIVIITTVIEKEPKHVTVPAPVLVPGLSPKSVQPMTLEERARMAGMSVDQLIDMRMRNKERGEGN